MWDPPKIYCSVHVQYRLWSDRDTVYSTGMYRIIRTSRIPRSAGVAGRASLTNGLKGFTVIEVSFFFPEIFLGDPWDRDLEAFVVKINKFDVEDFEDFHLQGARKGREICMNSI